MCIMVEESDVAGNDAAPRAAPPMDATLRPPHSAKASPESGVRSPESKPNTLPWRVGECDTILTFQAGMCMKTKEDKRRCQVSGVGCQKENPESEVQKTKTFQAGMYMKTKEQ